MSETLTILKKLIRIIVFLNLNEANCNSSSGKLLRRAHAKTFCSDIGIPITLTAPPYNEKAFASNIYIYVYIYAYWLIQKSVWRFTSNRFCNYILDITEDYQDLPLLHKKVLYIMKAFVDNTFKGARPIYIYIYSMVYTINYILYGRTLGREQSY